MQNLIKKHQAVLAEINNHDGRIAAVIEAGKQMMEDEHFASDEIRNRVNTLQDHWVQLTDKSKQVNLFGFIPVRIYYDEILIFSVSKILKILFKLISIMLMRMKLNHGCERRNRV